MRQKYSTENLFPVRTFFFKCPDSLLYDTLEKAKTLEYRKYNDPYGVGTSNDIHANPDFRDTFAWFQQCVDTLHKDNGWQCAS